jgi:glutathione S-transferase
MTKAILYSGTKNASSWAMRAWLALRAAQFEFRELAVDIRRPQRFANLEQIGRFSPPAMVPVLVVDDDVIFDSLAIMEFANDTCDGRLLPRDPIGRARARSILAWQHSGLSGIAKRISFESAFYPLKRALTLEESMECARLFKPLEKQLASSGGPYLFNTLTLADLALVPAIVRLTRHAADLEPWPHVREWCNAIMELRLVEEWLAEADRLPHIWLDDYLNSEADARQLLSAQNPAKCRVDAKLAPISVACR